MKFLFTFLTCFIISQVALGYLIIGGQEVSATDPIATTTVQIQTDTLLESGFTLLQSCTATILSSQILVTAAHCLTKKVLAIEVYFHINDKGPNRPPVISKRFIIHPDYRNTDDPDKNDIALILLSQPIPSNYTSLRLLPKNIQITPKRETFVAGYGEDDPANFSGFGTLRQTSLSVLGPSGKTEVILDQTGGRGVCDGDSGGPAFFKINGIDFTWGLASRHTEDNCTSPIVYTKISSQMDFIRKATAKLLNSSSTLK